MWAVTHPAGCWHSALLLRTSPRWCSGACRSPPECTVQDETPPPPWPASPPERHSVQSEPETAWTLCLGPDHDDAPASASTQTTQVQNQSNEAGDFKKDQKLTLACSFKLHLCGNPALHHTDVVVRGGGFVHLLATVGNHKYSSLWKLHISGPQRVKLYQLCLTIDAKINAHFCLRVTF